MGAGELGLNLFHEIPETVRIIRRAYRDPALREALLRPRRHLHPPLLRLLPRGPSSRRSRSRAGLEGIWRCPTRPWTSPPAALPLPDRRSRAAHPAPAARGDPAPARPGPLAAWAQAPLRGGLRSPRRARGLRASGDGGGPSRREALFLDPEVARAATGFFRAAPGDGGIRMEIQLREGMRPGSELRAASPPLSGTVCPRASRPCELFAARHFPEATTHERKHHYLAR